jgi:hypothetical protein
MLATTWIQGLGSKADHILVVLFPNSALSAPLECVTYASAGPNRIQIKIRCNPGLFLPRSQRVRRFDLGNRASPAGKTCHVVEVLEKNAHPRTKIPPHPVIPRPASEKVAPALDSGTRTQCPVGADACECHPADGRRARHLRVSGIQPQPNDHAGHNGAGLRLLGRVRAPDPFFRNLEFGNRQRVPDSRRPSSGLRAVRIGQQGHFKQEVAS